MRSFLKYWLPLLIWLCVIFVGSTDLMSAEHTSRFLIPFLRWLDPHISSATIAAVQLAFRKFGHLAEYAIFAALLWRALRRTLSSTKPIVITAIALVGSAIFAASDEFHQSFIRSRTGSLGDMVLDLCGAFIGLAIFSIFTRSKKMQAEAK